MVINLLRRRDRWAARCYRVLFNGLDVSRQTFYVDRRRGIVRLYLTNAEGCFFLGSDGVVATVERRGRVELLRARKDSN